jgi:ribonuclease E
VVRTRNDVALYVLNHKRGHLRDLENAFKVSLSIVSDPNVSGLQSYIIDRGEQVHTLEAAKALIAAQAAAHPMHGEDAPEDEAFDAELESEVETEETESLAEEAGETGDGEGEQEDGQRRGKRRRRRRGRGGSEREASHPREDGEPGVAEQGAETPSEAGAEDDESEEQPSLARGDNQDGGERRPRRRGRRGGRRRRGGTDREDGLAGSISDEFSPPQPPEAETAVADFDGGSPEPAPSLKQPEPVAASQPSLQPEDHVPQAASPAQEEPAHESEKAARRRSTVREKVSFASSSAPSEAAAPANQAPEPGAGGPTESAADSNGDAQPRKAGWWSRRFGGGE